jgi:hypothetical protein
MAQSVNKEQYLVFLMSYLIIVTMLLSFVVTTINNGLSVDVFPIFVTDNPFSTGQFVANMGNIFIALLNPVYLLPEQVMSSIVQIVFIKLPQMAILVILLSYIKDVIP